jgi:hypothetical protein
MSSRNQKPLVPADFVVPERLETGDFLLRMLAVSDVAKDYAAVMSSVEHIRGVFGKGDPWPEDDLSFEQDLIDLGWHQKEFQRRTSFAYTVMAPDESICLGCMYIYPNEKTSVDAHVILWVTAAAYEKGLDPKLYAAVKSWIKDRWPFKAVAYPGRDISWDEWQAVK